MTSKKTEDDLKPHADGPELINADASDDTVKALRARYPKARAIEKLASGNYAVRFRGKKRTIYPRNRH